MLETTSPRPVPAVTPVHDAVAGRGGYSAMKRTTLTRRTPLKPGTARLEATGRLERRTRIRPRKAARKLPENALKLPMVEGWNKAALERAKALHAARWGCEYATFLRARFRHQGCEICGAKRRTCHLHHTRTIGAGGTAEHLLPICAHCHDRGHHEGFAVLEMAFGLDFAERAALLAAIGIELDLLTLERCEVCETWHSLRYMVDLAEGSTTKRACTVTCVPEGPR